MPSTLELNPSARAELCLGLRTYLVASHSLLALFLAFQFSALKILIVSTLHTSPVYSLILLDPCSLCSQEACKMR